MDRRTALITLAISAALWTTAATRAGDFRVETDVFADNNDEEPVAETLTIFSDGLVYDFMLKESEEITIFDVHRGRILLLDAKRRQKTELTTEQLLEFTAAIKTLAHGQSSESLFDPVFTVRDVEESGALELASPSLTYRANGVRPKDAQAVQQFREFADWYARLNAVRPGNPPPFGRLELNQALAERQLIPEEIEREIVLDGRLAKKKLQARSRHSFVWALSTTDRKRIEQAGRMMADFDKIAPAEYWRVPSVAVRKR